MSQLQAIKARIGAARLVLQEHRGTVHHGQLSKIQAAVVIDVITKTELSGDDRSALSTAALRVPWAESDLTAVLGVLSSIPRSLPAGKRRRLQQTWTALHNFFSADQWDLLMSPEMSSTAKLDIILQHAAKLGLRLPSEPSSKWLASLWMVTGETENLQKYDANQKRSLYVYVKDRFHTLTNGMAEPPQWLDRLPETPVELHRDAKVLFDSTYDQIGMPVPSRIPAVTITTVNQTYACRSSAKPATIATISADPMHMVNAMMQAQMRMLENMAGQMNRGGRGASAEEDGLLPGLLTFPRAARRRGPDLPEMVEDSAEGTPPGGLATLAGLAPGRPRSAKSAGVDIAAGLPSAVAASGACCGHPS